MRVSPISALSIGPVTVWTLTTQLARRFEELARVRRHHRDSLLERHTEPGEATRATPKGLPWPIWVASSVMPSHGRRCEPYNRTSRRVDLMKRHVWVELGLELKDTFSLVEQA